MYWKVWKFKYCCEFLLMGDFNVRMVRNKIAAGHCSDECSFASMLMSDQFCSTLLELMMDGNEGEPFITSQRYKCVFMMAGDFNDQVPTLFFSKYEFNVVCSPLIQCIGNINGGRPEARVGEGKCVQYMGIVLWFVQIWTSKGQSISYS